MESMGTVGFITAGLAIMALVRLLAVFRELRAELLVQRERMAALTARIDVNEQTLSELKHDMPDLSCLLQRIEQAEKRAVNPRYEEAARLARGGANDGGLAARCGLSRGEARLVSAMWRSQAQSRDTAEVD